MRSTTIPMRDVRPGGEGAMAHSRVPVGIVLLAVLTGVVLMRSGAANSIPRTVALDGVPSAVVVARQTGRAFITTHDSNGQNGSGCALDTRTGALLPTVA